MGSGSYTTYGISARSAYFSLALQHILVQLMYGDEKQNGKSACDERYMLCMLFPFFQFYICCNLNFLELELELLLIFKVLVVLVHIACHFVHYSYKQETKSFCSGIRFFGTALIAPKGLLTESHAQVLTSLSILTKTPLPS